MNKDEYERLVNEGAYLPIGKGKQPANECMIITMYRTRHPEQTVSYRFKDQAAGKVFVLKTDHENEDGVPFSLREHLKEVDLLIMDSQYTREIYDQRTAGFGHGTPDYCAKIAYEVKAKKLGLTHHDPPSKDSDIDKILKTARLRTSSRHLDEIFACKDYLEVEV